MKYLILIASLVIVSCNSGKRQFPKAENALDAGREFIDATLKGDFEKAGFYMLSDEENKKLLQQYQTKYNTQSKQDQFALKQSVINILEVNDVSEKETIINYSNSFNKVAHKIKVVNVNGNWLADFKYTFDGNL